MASPKAKTLQQQLGFLDDDLKAPQHDEIVIWLDSHMDEVVSIIFGSQPENWINKEIRYSPKCDRDGIKSLPMPDKPLPKANKIWEYPIKKGDSRVTNNYKYIIGFCDLFVDYQTPQLIGSWQEIEFRREPKWFVDYRHALMIFEIKTKIPSLGEVIRQIRMYQEFTSSDIKWFVVSPDAKFMAQFISQGINFIKYNPDVNLVNLVNLS